MENVVNPFDEYLAEVDEMIFFLEKAERITRWKGFFELEESQQEIILYPSKILVNAQIDVLRAVSYITAKAGVDEICEEQIEFLKKRLYIAGDNINELIYETRDEIIKADKRRDYNQVDSFFSMIFTVQALLNQMLMGDVRLRKQYWELVLEMDEILDYDENLVKCALCVGEHNCKRIFRLIDSLIEGLKEFVKVDSGLSDEERLKLLEAIYEYKNSVALGAIALMYDNFWQSACSNLV